MRRVGRRGSVAERLARGKAARRTAPRTSHAAVALGPDRRDPVEVLEEQARTRLPELLPIRYGRMASSPFAFFRGAAAVMAMDLATTPGLRDRRPAVRRRAPGQLRHLQLAGAASRLRPQRLRRDAARAVGVGRQAARGLRRRGRAARAGSPRSRRATSCARRWRPYRTVDGRVRRRDATSTVWYSRFEVDDALKTVRGRVTSQRYRQMRSATSAKFAARDNLQAFSRAHRRGRRPAALRAPTPPLVVPVRASCSGCPVRGGDRVVEAARPRPRGLPADPRRRPPPARRRVHLRRPRPQGRRRRERGHPRVDRAAARPGRARPADPAVQGGAGLGARALPRRQRVRPGRAPRRLRPAPDAGRERHLPRLVPRHRASTASSATSTSASCATARAASTSRRWSRSP